MTHNIYLYILVAALVSTLIRVIPLTLIRGKIQNPFLRSFLYYVPYATLAVMTFPAIITAPQLPLAGILALIVGVVAAWRGINMMGIAAICCVVVFFIVLLTGSTPWSTALLIYTFKTVYKKLYIFLPISVLVMPSTD